MNIGTLIQQAMADFKNINQIIADNKALASQGPYGPRTTASIESTLKHAIEAKEKMLVHIKKLDNIRKEINSLENAEEKQKLIEEAAKRARMVAFLVGGAATIAALAGSIFIYKRFFSKAAKACAGQKGDARINCVSKFKITGFEQSIRSLRKNRRFCGRNDKSATCRAKIDSRINSYQSRIRKQKAKLKEGTDMRGKELVVEGYINYLFDPDYSVEKEWRGNNLPVEGDCRPNWIRECMLLDCDREKIMCLRKLRETTAMNAFYGHRIDRFIDAITLNYDASGNDGMVAEVQD